MVSLSFLQGPELYCLSEPLQNGVHMQSFLFCFIEWWVVKLFTHNPTAWLIAASHAQLAAGGDPVVGVIGLGLGYAACNQLMWAGFPSVCPQDIMALGAGIVVRVG